ncbi:endonuclease/exonuclease/phosphatase family protein [Polaribacter uvawellassae]|uniref:endonuclease/exonuclease/phosphatase family protein n=1 Tax=Polaribacter uvawellassae TaxID=3133495 RepID=UPI0032190582
MKKKSFFDRLFSLLNSLFATLLLLSYLLPYISPKSFSVFAVISLFVPILFIINLLFFIYWLLKLKKQLILSAFVLLIGWFTSSPFYKFSNDNETQEDDLKVMSYNVRMFNFYKWNKDENLAQKTFDFINSENPDILALQEFYASPVISFSYPHQFIKTTSKNNKFGQAIYSKYPIINSGSLDFKDSGNNIIYVDVLKDKDTVRVYNIHLESLSINTDKEYFGEENNQKLLGRFRTTFKKQAIQTEQFLAHEESWKGKKIILGDFNNTAFSWVYRKIKSDKKDAFVEAGQGFGKTFDYSFPMRIDFILTSADFEINKFTTFDKKYSDHFPILARINW